MKIKGYDIIYNWFDILKSNGHFVKGFVAMPNHIHAITSFIESPQSIITIIGNGTNGLWPMKLLSGYSKWMKQQYCPNLAGELNPKEKQIKIIGSVGIVLRLEGI